MSHLSDIKTFLFDMGNVLVRFSHPRMHRQMAEVLGLATEEVEAILAADRIQWRYEAGQVSTPELLRHFRALARRPFDDADLLDAACDIFDPILEMQPVLERLKGAGYRLVIVSNTNEAHLDYVRRRFDFLKFFDDLVLSYAVKAMKPDQDFYAAALEAARCPKEAALFIDDLAENVTGAANFGFPAVQFTSPTAFVEMLAANGLPVT